MIYSHECISKFIRQKSIHKGLSKKLAYMFHRDCWMAGCVFLNYRFEKRDMISYNECSFNNLRFSGIKYV